MKQLSDYIATMLSSYGIIQKDKISLCSYGLEIFISSSIEVICILILSLIVHNFAETLLFFTAFIPLRIYSGGFHAETRLKCFLVSLAVYAIFTLIILKTPYEIYYLINLSIAAISQIIVLTASPIIHHNKSVNEKEKIYYRKKSLTICTIETVIILTGTLLIPKSRLIASFTLGQAGVTVSMLAAVIKYNK